ncbi:MAG: type III-A CRISPR-associated RAMP protein Csm3 [Chloroflexi bacterium]|nr:type III-A CRISPR-associated RAMP protein Csm3 [Chloroflexota bacterium]
MADAIPATLYGRLIWRSALEVVTGLHIGTSPTAVSGLDLPIVRDPLTGQPYLPGSSLRGKLRASLERLLGLAPTTTGRGGVQYYVPQSRDEYEASPIGRLFGVPGTRAFPTEAGARLVVRDAFLAPESVAALRRVRTELPYAEVKAEAAVDRVTAEAVPRHLERIPAGVRLAPLELVYSIYSGRDLTDFAWVVRGLQAVEDDYLGGHGSRGSGKVRFLDIELALRSRATYRGEEATAFAPRRYPDLAALHADLDPLLAALRSALALPA